MDELAQASSFTDRLDRVAARFGTSVALQYLASATLEEVPRVLRYRDFVALARRRAHALAQLSGGGVIAGLLPISATSYPAQIAAMAAGTLAPLNYFLEPAALITLIRASGASVLLTAGRYDDDPQCADKIAKIRAAIPLLRHVVYDAENESEGSLRVETLEAGQPDSHWPSIPGSTNPDRVLGLFHTGGTTGLPKLVPHTQAMYLAMADTCARAQGSWHGEVMMAPLPQFHTSGALQAGLAPLLSGAELVIPSSRGFRAPEMLRNYWRFVARHRVSVVAGVPTILSALAATPPDGDVSSVRRILCGGAPLSVHVIETLKGFMPSCIFLEGWGMTETCGFSVMNPPGGAKVGAVGLPFPGVEVQIRKPGAAGDASVACRTDEVGEVVVRGDIVIRRYHDERPGAFTGDGWLRTGDRGRLDEDAYLWITGRLKDLIIRGGHNIEPALIEEPAYQHPAVQLAAAVGRPDRHAGELPVLYVQLKPGAVASETEIAAFIGPFIQERAAVPKAVRILPQLPLSGPGKISKLLLRREAARELLQSEIDQAATEFGLCVALEIVDDDRFDQVAVLRLESGEEAPALLKADIARVFEGYTFRHHWH